jgi:hypothetical protein
MDIFSSHTRGWMTSFFSLFSCFFGLAVWVHPLYVPASFQQPRPAANWTTSVSGRLGSPVMDPLTKPVHIHLNSHIRTVPCSHPLTVAAPAVVAHGLSKPGISGPTVAGLPSSHPPANSGTYIWSPNLFSFSFLFFSFFLHSLFIYKQSILMEAFKK